MVPLSYYLALSGFLFACGVAGFLIKRNIITIFMSIELMLNGVNLSFVAFAAHWHVLAGQVFACRRRHTTRAYCRIHSYLITIRLNAVPPMQAIRDALAGHACTPLRALTCLTP